MIKVNSFLTKIQVGFLIFVCFIIAPIILMAGNNIVDLSESILKLGNYKIYNLGSKGFAAYDDGDNKLKFFDWNFNQTASIPITFGEGPGEIRQAISSVFVDNDNIFINGIFEKKIYIYDMSGKIHKSIPIKNTPYKVALRNKNIYTINYTMTGKAKSAIGWIVNPYTDKEAKSVILKQDLFQLKDIPEGSEDLYGQWNAYDIDHKGNIYLLIGGVQTLFILDDSGMLNKKIQLPYKHNMEIKDIQSGKKVFRQISVYGWYKDIAVNSEHVYICYVNQVGKDKSGQLFYETNILRFLPSGKYDEIIVKGFCSIMGFNKERLFVFNMDDYHAIPCKFDNKSLK